MENSLPSVLDMAGIRILPPNFRNSFLFTGTVEFHLSVLIGTASHPDKQKNPDNWTFL